MNAEIQRVYLPTATFSSWYVDGVDEVICKIMELPWKGNKRAISCIPEGKYRVTKEKPIPANDPKGRKERPYWHFRIHDVPGRSGILIHKITFVKDLKGCLGTGSAFFDFDKDGVPDMAESTKALEKLVALMPDEFTLTITKKR